MGEMTHDNDLSRTQAYLFFIAGVCFFFFGTMMVPLCGAEIATAWMIGNSILAIGFIILSVFKYYRKL